MRVLLDVSAVPALPVGAGVYTVELCRALGGHAELELHLLTRIDDARRWEAIAPRATIHPEVPGSRPARLVWEQLQAPRLAERLSIDVWHGPHYTMPLRLEVPAVVTVHDLTFFDHPEWHERSKVLFFRRMIRESAQRAHTLVAVSEFTARRLTEVLEPRASIRVVPHGVDHDRFRPDAPLEADIDRLRSIGAQQPFVAFAGVFEPRKDLPTLVRAFSSVARRHRDLRLVLAGRDGWGALPVRDAVERSRVGSRILRPGYVAADTLPALFRRAAVATGAGRLTVLGRRARRDRPYVERLTVDGLDHDRPWLRARDLGRAATLRFELTDAPTAWGTRPDGAPPSFPPDAVATCDAP